MVIVVVLIGVALGAGAWWWFTQRESDDGVPSNPGTASPIVDPNAGSKRNWLEGTAGAVAGRHFHIGERTVTLGRKPQNFIQVAGRSLDR